MYKEYLSKEIIDDIVFNFSNVVPNIFRESLLFCFICGGFAKGYATNQHDIDMFICVKEVPEKEFMDDFLNWYFSIHKKWGLPPDCKYPGEIVVIKTLEEKINFLSHRRLRRTIKTFYEYEAILWTDMISGKKIGLIVQDDVFFILEKTCKGLERRWREEVAQALGLTPHVLGDTDLRRLFKKFLVYKKKGKNNPPVGYVIKTFIKQKIRGIMQ